MLLVPLGLKTHQGQVLSACSQPQQVSSTTGTPHSGRLFAHPQPQATVGSEDPLLCCHNASLELPLRGWEDHIRLGCLSSERAGGLSPCVQALIQILLQNTVNRQDSGTDLT